MELSLKRMVFSSLSIWIAIAILALYWLHPLRKSLRFGIDLVGGTYITLEVQTEKAIEADLIARLSFITDHVLKNPQALVSKEIKNNNIVLTFKDQQEASQAARDIAQKQSDLTVNTDRATVTARLSDRQEQYLKSEAVQRNIEVLRRRLDKLSVAEITIAAQGDRNIVVELPDVSDPAQAKAMIGTPAILEFRLVHNAATSEQDLVYQLDGEIPSDMEILPGKEDQQSYFYLVSKYPEVTGRHLKDASAQFADRDAQMVVAFSLTPEGGEKFYELTSKNIGKPLAIVLDRVVISAPVIQSKLRDQGSISGNFTVEFAKELALMLKSGAFVAPVTFEEERQVGPALGAESIKNGLIACGIALVFLFLFSIVFYKVTGIAAFITLLYNLILILLGLMYLRATLTLPGIAGMVLTVGMAIDASILIFERIREDLASGATVKKAVNDGFSDAMSVILDANITTFIVGVVLYRFGSGPIQGFAITMMLGIVATLITGLFFLRSLLNFVIDNFHIKKLRI